MRNLNLKTVLKTAVLVLSAVFICSCSKSGETAKTAMKVGMVTDAGTIDDKSFNQGTWEGIVRAEKELGVEIKYLKPVGTTEADYVKEISNLYDSGYKLIICPGFKFETAIFKTQTKYPDAKLVIIDGNAHPADSYDASALSAVWKFLPFRNSTGVGSRGLCMRTRTSAPKLSCTRKTLYIREHSATLQQVSRLQPLCLTAVLPVSMLQRAVSVSA